MQEILHSLSIEQQKNIIINGVEAVNSFSESQIILTLQTNNKKLYVTGTGLKITGFSKNTGNFTATGQIVGVKYGSKNLRSRIFR